MKGQMLKSTRASAWFIAMAGASLILMRIGYVNAVGELLPLFATDICYAAFIAFAIAALRLALFHARNLNVIIPGLIVLAISHALLNSLDPITISFLMRKDHYLAAIADSSEGEPRFKVFNLKESHGFPAGGTWEYVIFDSTEQIGLPVAERNAEWQQIYGGYITSTSLCDVTTRHLEEHFFYVLQRCGI